MSEPARPSSGHTARYRASDPADGGDGRLRSPTFERNSPPIISALAPWLRDRVGPVLEIGAGTGQHACAFARAFVQLDWWPSDPDALHRASISAWQKALGAPVRPPLPLDASTDWAADRDIQNLGPLTVVISLNVIHIAPISVAHGIVAGAGRALAQNSLLIFYGPFRENGQHTGAGNIAFDRGLRAEDASWGVRDTGEISALATDAGLELAALIAMPANNRLLIFRKN